MTFTRHFFIDGQFLGSAPAPVAWHHEQQCAPIGQAFFCPICSELWANCPVEGQPSTVRHRHCAKHPPGTRHGESSLGHVHGFEVAGSLFLDEEARWNASLPPRVVQREFALHLRYAVSRWPGHIASAASDILKSIHQR